MSLRVALLEDDEFQSSLIKLWLSEENHSCAVFDNGRALIRHLNNESFDVIVLDWMVPDMDSIEVLRWIREQRKLHVPIIFLSQLEGAPEVVRALKLGADDYIRKPAQKNELIARIHAATRRFSKNFIKQPTMTMPPYTIDYANSCFLLDDAAISMTQKEFELASFLFNNVNRALSRGHILESVWGTDPGLNTRTVDTHISRIRKKLQITSEKGWVLNSIYQHGYRLENLDPDHI